MANNLSLSVRLELLAEKFRQQAEGAKASLRGIQFQALAMAGALGAGVTSLQGLVSSLVTTAREAGRARTILRNVSKDTREYGQSLRYVSELADKYGTDLIGTTDAFAKFKAAAGSMGVAAAEQERIFSNISKAMASFGLSGGEASLTMVAITQMMSKGKISSEELRRQLGERMPIAMQAMANAAGVSLSELEKLLKAGALRSADIMGKFSDELAKLSGDTSTDNLEASLGRLKNSFTGLTDELNIYEHFKSAVDKVKELLDYLRGHLSNLFIWAGALLGYRLWGKFSTAFGEASALIRNEQAKAVADDAEAKRRAEQAAAKAQKALNEADARIARAEAALQAGYAPTDRENKRVLAATDRGNARFASAVNNLQSAQSEYRQLTALHDAYLRGLEAKELEVAQRLATAKAGLEKASASGDKSAEHTARLAYERVQAEASRLQVANATKREQAEIRYTEKAEALQKKVAAAGEALNKAQHERKELLAKAHAQNEEARAKRLSALQASLDREREAKQRLAPAQASVNAAGGAVQAASQGGLSFSPSSVVQAQEQAASTTVSIWTRTATTFRVLWTSAVASVRAIMSSLAPMAILTVITAIVTKAVDWFNEQKRINGAFGEYQRKAQEVLNTKSEEATQAWRLFGIYQSLNGKVAEQKEIQTQLEKVLGLQEGSLDRIAGKYGQIKGVISQILKLKEIDRQIDFYSGIEKEQQKTLGEALQYHLKRVPNANITPKETDTVNRLFAILRQASPAEKERWNIQGRERNPSGTTSDVLVQTRILNSLAKERLGRFLTPAEKEYAYSINNQGLTYQSRDKYAVASTIQAYAGKQIDELTVQRLKVEGEANSTLKSIGGSFAGASSSAPSAEDEAGKKKKKVKESPLARARRTAGEDIAEINNKHSAGLYKSEEEYKLALDAAAQRHREGLAAILGAKSAQDRQFQELGKLLIADRALVEEKAKTAEQLEALRTRVYLGLATEDDLRNATAERAKVEVETAISLGKALDTEDEWLKVKLSEIAATSAIASVSREYAKSAEDLKKERLAGLLTEKEYKQALLDLIQATRRKAVTTATQSPAEEAIKGNLQTSLKQDTKALQDDLTPRLKSRDTTFDYKKDEADRLKEERAIMGDYIEELKKAQKAGLDVADALEAAQEAAENADQALRLAELQGDLKKYNEAVKNQAISGMKNIAQSARNLKSAFDGLQKAFDPDSNASAWERFFAVFDSATQGIDTILSLVDTIEQFTKARKLAITVERAFAAEKVAADATTQASTLAATSTEVTASATRQAATSAETTKDVVGATAKVAKAHAALPFVGVAIAGAMVGAMIAMIASSANKVPKFANGGIVPGGDGSGDRVLARVNPGELILNKAQQGRLANHLTQATALRVEVEGRIRGKDILQLSNSATRKLTR